MMIRTQIQLEEIQYKELRTIGDREAKGLAEQVREAVALYLSGHRARSLPPLEELAAGFHGLPSAAMDELKTHDRWVAEAISESKRK